MNSKFEAFNHTVEFAVVRLRALRALPKTESTERAQQKILNRLSIDETTTVAVRLAELENPHNKEVSRG
jgi:hypothetical protein